MTNRERALACLRYESYDRLPVVHFGFLHETLRKWVSEGHLSEQDIEGCGDATPTEQALATRLGFDFNWQNMVYPGSGLRPPFATKVIEERPDGSCTVQNGQGMIVLQSGDAGSIPAEVDYLLKGRREWEELYLPKLQFAADRIDRSTFQQLGPAADRQAPLGLHCGSLYGEIRNWLGIVALSYLYADDEPLFREIVDTVADLCYGCVEAALATGAEFDFAHFWEDICFKNGPLVNPAVFAGYIGPHYRRITDLVNAHGLDIVSLDCDGKIDALVPVWFENGVNTMFPIEVGTWEADIRPWREQFGRGLRGIGGMNKRVFSRDRQAVDAEIERLKALVDMGGFLPCPDHRIAGDAEWNNVRYYCDRMRQTFGG